MKSFRRPTYSFLSAAGNTRIEQEIRDAVLNSAASKGHPLCELLAMATMGKGGMPDA